jgi:hypothetical protein
MGNSPKRGSSQEKETLEQNQNLIFQFLGKYGNNMKDGDKRGKTEKGGSDFTMWALKRYGLHIRFELIPKTFEKQRGDQFTLSLLAPALNECGINVGVIGEVLRDFNIYVVVFVETEGSSTERESLRDNKQGWSLGDGKT